jgi:hypothetical protein
MNPNDFLTENESIQEARNKALQERAGEAKHKNEISQVLTAISNVSTNVSQSIANKSNIVSVSNLPTKISTPDIEKVVLELKVLREQLTPRDPEDKKTHELLTKLLTAIDNLPKSMPEMPSIEFPGEISINNQVDYKNAIQSVVDAVKAIEVNVQPNITVKPTEVKVQSDFKQLESKLDILTTAVKAISIVVPENDDSELLKRISATTKAINSLSFPVPNYVLPFRKADGSATQAVVGVDGQIATSLSSGKTIKFASVSVSQAGDNQIVAAVTGKIKVLSAALVASGTVNLKWRSATTDLSGAIPLVANSGFVLPASSPGQGNYLETAAGEALNINLSGGVQVSGHISYYEE